MEEQHTEIFQDFLAWTDSPCDMDCYENISLQRGWESPISSNLEWLSPRKPGLRNDGILDGYDYSYRAIANMQPFHSLKHSALIRRDIPKSPNIGDQTNQSCCTISKTTAATSYQQNFIPPIQLNPILSKDVPIHPCMDNICKLAKQRHGCQLLLHQLQSGIASAAYQEIIETCIRYFGIWMKHPIANFLCQQVWKCISEKQRIDILRRYSDDTLPKAALHTYGTRVVQVMISTTCRGMNNKNDTIYHYLQSVLSSISQSLFKDVNGAHIIQHCFLYWSSEDNEFLYRTIQEHFLELATHRQGCCMIQTSMDFATPSQLDDIVASTMEHIFVLIHDAFGNYVVQHILDSKYPQYIYIIMKKLQGHWYEMSIEKFSSNITEKCLQLAGETQRWEMIEEIAKDSSNIAYLLHDAYGNYVLQRMLQVASQPQKIRLKEWIEKYWNTLSRSRYGKQIQYNLERLMNCINC